MLLISFLIFLIGISFGSFLNVLIDRSSQGKGLLGRSFCDSCEHKLAWLDNIPIFSFFLLARRCRYCGDKIAWQYPIVEFTTGLILLISFYRFFQIHELGSQSIIFFLFWFLYVMIFIAIALWDFKFMVIPDWFIVAGILVFLAESFVGFYFNQVGLYSAFKVLTLDLIGGLLVFSFFLIIFFISGKKGIGVGDIKLGFWLGTMIGLKLIYFFLFLSYFLGSLFSIALVLTGSKSLKSKLPFGPFLVFSAWIVMIFSDFFIKLYHAYSPLVIK